ncbi:unnamed protein product [Diamesa serratosioi]
MPPPTRPHRGHGSMTGRSSGSAPMSERQQMALLMQMTSTTEAELSPGSQRDKAKDRNERGETPLHIAAKKGDSESIRKLLDQGINPNTSDFAGWTPLHEAANHGHYNVAVILVKAGANVNAQAMDDVTPLHDACLVGQLKMVKMLLEKGADPQLKNKKGKTPQDVAHPSLHNFFATQKMANRRENQLKKPVTTTLLSGATVDTKKATTDSEEAVGNVANSSTNAALNTGNTSKEEDDVYEFISTPKHSSCSSGDENAEKSADEKSGTDSDVPIASLAASATSSTNQQQKRTLSDPDNLEESSSTADEDSKRKKRKDSESVTKEVKGSINSNRVVARVGQKPPGPASKTMGLISKGGNITSATADRKSPCESPKPTSKATESDTETDDGSKGDALKVPPLKIVIPQQNGSNGTGTTTSNTTNSNNDTDANNTIRASKNITARSNQSLPYIVAASSNSNDSTTDKEGRQSPSADSNKSSDDKKSAKTAAEERAQRVLRSSLRSGKDADRGSNNSSPQLQTSSTPSPAAPNTESASAGESDNPQNVATTNSSTNSITTPITTQAGGNSTTAASQLANSVELHPRKRKIKTSTKEPTITPTANTNSSANNTTSATIKEEKPILDANGDPIHPHDQPITNCYQMYLNIRKQIEQRHRGLYAIQPKPPQEFKDYLMNRRTYVLAGKTKYEPTSITPANLPQEMKDLFTAQERERYKLKMQHIVEKEKLVLSKEQEILRAHGKAAQMMANQVQPFSVCTILKDEEVYNIITPEQEEKYRNKNRERSHGRAFFKALTELDDKWDKMKEAMITRHTNEAESLHAVQKMDWGWKMKEVSLCDYKANPQIEELHVPMVDVTDDYTTPSLGD